MIDQMLSLIKIRQELPDAIGYALTEENHIFSLPDEITDSCDKELKEKLSHLSCVYLRIDNFTNEVQKFIRVLLAGSSEFTPRILFRRRSNRATHEILSEENEIIIHEIPPNDSIYIIFYNPDNKFSIEQILVSDKSITPMMQKLAAAKRDPEIARLKFLAVFLIIIAILVSIGSIPMIGYALWNRHETDQIMKDAFSGIPLCQSEIFNNSAEKEKELERRIKQLGSASSTTLLMNHVSSLDELKLKDNVILCVPVKGS